MCNVKYIILVFALAGLRHFVQFAKIARTVSKLKQPHNGAVFWSGTRTNEHGKTVSVIHDAVKHAESMGGATVEMTMKKKGVSIAENNKYSPRLWNIASEAYAKNAKGDIHVVMSETSGPRVFGTRWRDRL
ncbi:hypothetical protein CPB83DRAFT_881023 [Crepidotus variabilis]|uniref:Uncharacterized protein n=1 Tax=Crepidotus variabilis TaxID=179855 RepID=A0A9P6EMY5_9AGAR|nr:hypothetical protein CPB83DRAFT_881023 [Crepidotus variabilis]